MVLQNSVDVKTGQRLMRAKEYSKFSPRMIKIIVTVTLKQKAFISAFKIFLLSVTHILEHASNTNCIMG